MQREMISLQCQLQHSGSSVCSHILFCLRLCCIFFHFRQLIFAKQGFPACWLSSLNTEVDSLQKMIFVVLLQRLPREFSNFNLRTDVGFLRILVQQFGGSVASCCDMKTVSHATPCFSHLPINIQHNYCEYSSIHNEENK